MILNPRMVGSGKRTLVLSHGYGASQAIWDKVLPHLSRRNKVFLFDWDFSGGSAREDEAEEVGEHKNSCYTFSRFADELVALMDERKLSGEVYIGHSMAGMVGCIASIKRPDLFAHLVLVGASPRYMNSEDYEGGFDASDIDAMLSRISSDFRGWAEDFVPLAVGGSGGGADPWAVDRLARSFFAMDPRVAYALARMIFLGDQRAVLDDVAVPCTLVHVSHDFAAPPCVGRYMQKRMRRVAAAFETIDSVGHFPQLVAPDELLEVLNHLVLGDDDPRGSGQDEEELAPVVMAALAGEMNDGEEEDDAAAEVNRDVGLAPHSKLLA